MLLFTSVKEFDTKLQSLVKCYLSIEASIFELTPDTRMYLR